MELAFIILTFVVLVLIAASCFLYLNKKYELMYFKELYEQQKDDIKAKNEEISKLKRELKDKDEKIELLVKANQTNKPGNPFDLVDQMLGDING